MPKILFSQTDAQLCIDEALLDPLLTPERKQELIKSLMEASMISPRAFQILWRYRNSAAFTGDLAERASAASHKHPDGVRFRTWLDTVWENEPEPKLPALFTRSQCVARETLQATADVYFSMFQSESQIRPRTARLIAGPSGVGKTHLVSTFAEENGWAFLKLVFGEWIPLGGRGEPTKDVVARFLHENNRCVLFLDELDKIHTDLRNEWAVAILNELYCLLDRTWFQGQDRLDRQIRRKLRDSTFIVGCGTWQQLWENRDQRALGFQERIQPAMVHSIRAARVIPAELFNRFHPSLLFLEPLKREDFEQFCVAEQFDEQAAKLGIDLDYDQAVASGLGMRWIEAIALEVEIERLRRRTAMIEPCAEAEP